MTLSHSIANNYLYPEGAKHFADMLTVNQTLTSVRYAVAHLLLALTAVDGACFSFLRSLDGNLLCGISYAIGTYTAVGIVAITEMLKINTIVQSIRCALCAWFLAKRP